MILKKIIISAFAMCFLTGCLQNTAFIGPIFTVASTGSVYQAGLSYGSGQAIKKITGKTCDFVAFRARVIGLSAVGGAKRPTAPGKLGLSGCR